MPEKEFETVEVMWWEGLQYPCIGYVRLEAVSKGSSLRSLPCAHPSCCVDVEHPRTTLYFHTTSAVAFSETPEDFTCVGFHEDKLSLVSSGL